MKIKNNYSNKVLQDMLNKAFVYSTSVSNANSKDNKASAIKNLLKLEDMLLKIFDYVMEEDNGV